MTSERWRTIERLFDEAAALHPKDRDAFLDEACADEAQARMEVERLLALNADAESFFGDLSEQLGVTEDDRAVAIPPPERIGPFRVEAEIGSGGMGRVYRASRADGAFEQRVAIKVLAPGVASHLADRFRQERQILARLRHPGIARLLSGGALNDGRPYLVMEHVQGEPVTAYADRKQLPIDERLLLFRDVCDAVAYAHRALVVHRDIKPSNVFVEEDDQELPQVKLLDFGIAKLIERDENGTRTVAEQRIMTPEYAAPEQVRGEAITTATDVYALGVLLYELLTGTRPYQNAASRFAAEQAILNDEAARPSTILAATNITPAATTASASDVAAARGTSVDRLQRRLAGDLDRIVMKALRKEPERRYGSAEALGRDIERHLKGLPVEARPDTLQYRAGSFVRRHRTGVLAGTLAVLALIAALGISLWQGVRAERAAAAAQREATTAETVTQFLIGLFRSPDPYVNMVPKADSLTARDLLDRGVDQIEHLSDEPAVQARLYEAVALTYQGLGLYEPAADAAERSLTLRQDGYAAPPDEVASSLLTLGSIRMDEANLETARQMYRQALALYERMPGERDSLRADVFNRLAQVAATYGEHEEAEELYRRSLALNEATYGRLSPQVAFVLHNLADEYRHLGRFSESIALFDSSIAIQRRLPGDQELNLGASLALRAYALRDFGRVEEARRSAEEALTLLRTRLPTTHPRTVQAHVAYASALVRLGRMDAATPLLQNALQIRLDRWGESHWRTAEAGLWLGVSLSQQGRYAEAEPLLLRGYQGLLALRGPDDRYVQEIRAALSNLYRSWGRLDKAQQFTAPG